MVSKSMANVSETHLQSWLGSDHQALCLRVSAPSNRLSAILRRKHKYLPSPGDVLLDPEWMRSSILSSKWATRVLPKSAEGLLRKTENSRLSTADG
jgi:hypothetical protein